MILMTAEDKCPQCGFYMIDEGTQSRCENCGYIEV